MSTAVLAPVSEYLATSYRPDREYVDGVILERNLGEWDHSRLQAALVVFFAGLRGNTKIHAVPEQRVQVKTTRFRIPDVCVVAGQEPEEQILTKPPFVCIEILSKNDRWNEMQDRLEDYRAFGVPYIWVFDPREKRAWSYTREGIREPEDGIRRTSDPAIELPLAGIFA